MKTRSITRQTVVIVLVAQLACALALSGVALLHEWHARMRALDTQIQGRSDSLLGAIQDAEDPEDNVTIDPAELKLPTQDLYAVYSGSGRLIGESSPKGSGASLPRDGQAFSDLAIGRVQYRIYQRTALRIIDRAENGGVGLRRPVVIVYASPERHVLHEVFEGVGFFLLAIALVAIAASVVTALILRRTLRPIHELAAAAQQVSPASLQFPAPASALQVQELKPLANALSSLIDELREAFAKEQRFVGDAAHELKTAVAVLRSSVQVLLMKPRPEEEYVAGLQQVMQDNDRMEALVARMLELARVEQAPRDEAPLLDLAQACDDACRMLQPMADTAGVTLSLEAVDGIDIRLQVELAETLLTNLLSNAIRYSAQGATVRLVLQTQARLAELRIIDNGTGIRAEALPHVFERFYRDDPSRARQSGGTGLGLAICKSIVEGAGGTIAIASELGRGTTVTVAFRIA